MKSQKKIYFLGATAAAGAAMAGLSGAAVMNLAPLGTASASSVDFGSVAGDANDGNRDGVFGNGSVLHTNTTGAAGQFVEVDLGGERYLDRVLVFPRTDTQQNSVRDFTLEVFDAGGASVYSSNFLTTTSTADDPWGTAALSGTLGQRVRLTVNSTTVPNFFTLAELEVWGDTIPVPVNLAPGATITAGAAAFGTAIADGVDGDLASNYDSITDDRPIYHDGAGPGQGFYRLDFDSDINFDEIQLYNRIVNNLATTTTQYRVSILDSSDSLVTSQLVDAQDTNYDNIVDFSGFTGRSVLVEESNPGQFLAFSEVRVFGEPVPEPSTTLFGLIGGLLFLRRRR